MPIGDGGHHFACRLEKFAEGFDQKGMVIGKNDTRELRSDHLFPLDL
jgi:hypothetical protein